jgi:hypothetical protein
MPWTCGIRFATTALSEVDVERPDKNNDPEEGKHP